MQQQPRDNLSLIKGIEKIQPCIFKVDLFSFF